MKNSEKLGGRRQFFKKIFLGLVAFFFVKPSKAFSGLSQGIFSGLFGKKNSLNAKSLVAIGADPDYSRRSSGSRRFEIAKSLLNKSLLELTKEKDIKSAWGRVAGKDDIVGLKLNCMSAPNLSSSKEMVFAVAEGLKLAGVKENNIIIWERSNRELERGGFEINSSSKGVRCFGTDSLDQPFESKIEFSDSIGSLFSNIIANLCTTIINIGILKDHDLSGVCAGMKNFYGAIHNPNKYHDNNCNPYISDLCNHRYIKDKLKLTVIDAIVCQYQGGPAYNARWCSDINSIITGFDMVAVDRVAHDIIEKERKKNGLPSLKEDKRYPAYIETAEKLGLGIGDINRIKLLKI